MRPTLSMTDYNTLRDLTNHNSAAIDTEIAQLKIELNKATVVNDKNINSKVVRLNSIVKIRISESGTVSQFEIVLPPDANLKKNKISILAPMSIALLGYKEGEHFDWKMPGGIKHIKIINVINAGHK